MDNLKNNSEDRQESDGAIEQTGYFLGNMMVSGTWSYNSLETTTRDISINVTITDVYNAKISRITYAYKTSFEDDFHEEEYDHLDPTSCNYKFTGLAPYNDYTVKAIVYFEDIDENISQESLIRVH